MGTKVENIISNIPIKVLPKIIGEWDYGAINNMVQYLYRYAETIMTTLRGGKHRQICLIMKPELS